MTPKPDADPDDDDEFRPLGAVVFLLVIALFTCVSDPAGMRGIGFGELLGAVLGQSKGRFSYGLEGRPPSGYITGWGATALWVLLGLLGVGVMIWPEVALGVLDWRRGSSK